MKLAFERMAGIPDAWTNPTLMQSRNGFFATSDKIFKENIQNINNALEIVSNIGGKTFDWTDDYITEKGGVDGYFVNKSDFGVIAQDVQSVFPLAVRTRTDGTLAVDYIKLCALAFAAIRELKNEVDNLRKTI